jgi:hypothetical protein
MHLCLRKCLRRSLHVRARARVCCLSLRVHAYVSAQMPEMQPACARVHARVLYVAARACVGVSASA